MESIIINLIKDLKKKEIVDCHVSNDLVYNIKDKYILKVSTNIDRLRHEKHYNDLLINKLPVCQSIAFEIIDGKAYYLKEYVSGNNLCDKKYIDNPNRLISILVNAINMLHNTRNENGECFIHGDLCLPNIIVNEKDEIVAFIDLTYSTFSNNLWLDYAWIIWSFEFNLKSKEYTKDLLEALNIEFDQKKYDDVINNCK